MASIIKRKKNYSIVYTYVDENGRDQTEMGNSHFLSGGIEAQGGDRESEKLQLLPSAHQSEYCGVPVATSFHSTAKSGGAYPCMTAKTR